MKQFVDPATLMQLKSLELRARRVVEGFQSGLNRSPFHGFSVEFTEYRQYTQGDDPRYLDWRLYARTDRDYIKRFEDETNLRCQILLDASRSMEFGSLSYTKYEYARTLVATLGWFLTTQRDAVGLATFDEELREYLPARYRPGHFRRLMIALEQPPLGRASRFDRPLDQLAERLLRRGMVVVVSDFLSPLEGWFDSLGALAARGQEVVVFQILDPAELDFSFEQTTLFEDLETGRTLYIDPQQAADSYRRSLQDHLAKIAAHCEQLGIDYHRLRTDEPLENALFDVVRLRMHQRRLGRSSPAGKSR